MRYRSLIAVALTALSLFVAPPVTASAASCPAQVSLANAPPTTNYFDGNALLGPDPLPQDARMQALLAGYDRFGGMTEADWTNTYLPGGQLQWPSPDKYPDGFAPKSDGTPDKAKMELRPGTQLDRFGFAGGRFLAPVGTPFKRRALPPGNLDTPEGTPLSNYHEYCVVKGFYVDAGPIEPWFGETDGGTQYVLNADYFGDISPDLSVTWLLDPSNAGHKYLIEIAPS